MIVSIGEKDSILPPPFSHRIQALMWQIVDIHVRLWDEEGHNEAVLQSLHDDIIAMMVNFKNTFGSKQFSHSECGFLKFHLNLHLVETIKEYGSMRIVDTAFGESNNKGVKKIFMRTNRQRLHSAEMMLHATLRRRAILDTSLRQGKK